jgi:hypothetical protein
MHRSLNRTQTYSEGCGEDTHLPGRELNPSYTVLLPPLFLLPTYGIPCKVNVSLRICVNIVIILNAIKLRPSTSSQQRLQTDTICS